MVNLMALILAVLGWNESIGGFSGEVDILPVWDVAVSVIKRGKPSLLVCTSFLRSFLLLCHGLQSHSRSDDA